MEKLFFRTEAKHLLTSGVGIPSHQGNQGFAMNKPPGDSYFYSLGLPGVETVGKNNNNPLQCHCEKGRKVESEAFVFFFNWRTC